MKEICWLLGIMPLAALAVMLGLRGKIPFCLLMIQIVAMIIWLCL